MMNSDTHRILGWPSLFVALNLALISAVLLVCFSGLLDANGESLRRMFFLILAWLILTYTAYVRNIFDNWCDAFETVSIVGWQNVVAELVQTKFRPMVRTLKSVDEVSLAARELIVDTGNIPIFLQGRIIFLGAAANQSDKSRRDSLAISEDSERTPAQIYQGAVEEVMSNYSTIYRVISLLTDEEFASRSLNKKRQYISWLRNQISQLKRNKNYILFDNRRAPKWGASGAAIFTNNGYLQFTTVGGQALFVKDEWLSRHLVAAIMGELTGASMENKHAYTQMEVEEYSLYSDDERFGTNIPAERLQAHMDVLIEIL